MIRESLRLDFVASNHIIVCHIQVSDPRVLLGRKTTAMAWLTAVDHQENRG